MKNKVLIKMIVPSLDSSFDIFIPVNEVYWKIEKLVLKSISDLSKNALDYKSNIIIINKENNNVYKKNDIILDTDIRNASELIMLILN